MKLNGVTFENSDTCRGTAYVDQSAQIDMAEIVITGRYPERGWAVNHDVHEMVYIKKGLGSLAIRGKEEAEIAEGDVVSVGPGQRFAWSGEMTIIMACNPPFNPEQYEIEGDDNDEI